MDRSASYAIARQVLGALSRFLIGGGSIEQLEDKFDRYCKVGLDSFVDVYHQYYSEEFVKKVFDAEDADDKQILINYESKKLNLSTYLIKYDNFTNTVLNEQGEKVYRATTHAEGFYRDIFKKSQGNFERIIYITGISPVTLDDVTTTRCASSSSWTEKTHEIYTPLRKASINLTI